MKHQHETINNRVKQVCRRWRQLVVLKGGCEVVVLTLLTFLAATAVESFFDLNMAARVSLFSATATVLILCLTRFIFLPLRHLPGKYEIARYLEEKYPQLEDRLITAVEVGEVLRPGDSEVLLQKLMEDTELHIAPLKFRKSLKSSATVGWGISAAVLLLLIFAFTFLDPNGFSLRFGRILAPWQFPTVQPVAELTVTPGTAHVPKGSAQRIHAKLNGFESAAVFLYYSTNDSSWNKVKMDATMEENSYLFNFFDLQDETRYYVKADDRLSDVYTFTVYEAPQITRVDVTYTYPAYTKLSPKTEKDNGDVWAPEGTVVKIRAVTDKPLTHASLILGEDRALPTTIKADTVVTATLSVKQDDYYKIAVTGIDNLTNEPPPEYYIHAQPDEPPVLSIEWPARDLKASMLAEVPLRIRVADDFSIPDVKLKVVVNDEPEERELSLEMREVQNTNAGDFNDREFETTHLFYLEDMGVEPGDFVSYYVQVSDSHSAAGPSLTSDPYFIEVRPFRLEFQRPLSQQQQGAGGPMGGRLSETQREIFVATSKTEKRSKTAGRDELAADVDILVESQKNLMEVTESTLSQLQQRSAFTRDVGQNVTEHYTKAVKAMQDAINRLEDGDLVSAQIPERESLTELLHAEGQIEKVQIQRGQRGSQAQSVSLNELAQLFQDEMDNLKNKYETLDKPEPAQQPNEAFDKVKELARRQQDSNRKMRDLARSGLTEEEKKRRIEELRREQEKIRRETQELTRQMRQQSRQGGGLSRDLQDNLRRASSEMSDAAHNLRNENTELAAAKGTRALNRLNQLENMLRRNQKESLKRQLSDLDQQLQRLTEDQRDLAQEVSDLARTPKDRTASLEGTRRKQQDVQEQFDALEKQAQSLQKSAAAGKDELSRNMKKVTDDLARAGLSDKMQQAEKLIEQQQLNSAAQAQKDILARLEATGKQLTQMRNGLAETEEDKLDLALNQTRRLREELDAMQRQTQGVRQGQETSNPSDTPGRRSGQPGTGENRGSNPLETAQRDLMNEQLARSAEELQMMRRSLQADTSLARQAGDLSDRVDGLLRSFTGGIPERLTQIQEHVLTPLRGLEAELAQRLELIKNREKLFLAQEEKVPPGYQELVEKYYEALSKTK